MYHKPPNVAQGIRYLPYSNKTWSLGHAKTGNDVRKGVYAEKTPAIGRKYELQGKGVMSFCLCFALNLLIIRHAAA